VPKTNLTADQLIQRVADVLAQGGGEWIAEIANQVLTEKVTYVQGSDDSSFEVESKEEKPT
jgi:hypothetical protein